MRYYYLQRLLVPHRSLPPLSQSSETGHKRPLFFAVTADPWPAHAISVTTRHPWLVLIDRAVHGCVPCPDEGSNGQCALLSVPTSGDVGTQDQVVLDFCNLIYKI